MTISFMRGSSFSGAKIPGAVPRSIASKISDTVVIYWIQLIPQGVRGYLVC